MAPTLVATTECGWWRVSYRRPAVRGEDESSHPRPKETEMTQYMLSVHSSRRRLRPSDSRRCSRSSRRSTRYNQKARDAGIWVFAGGLEPDRGLDHGRQHRRASRSSPTAPTLESKEWIGGFWIFELPDLDAALAVGDRGLEGLRRARSRSGPSRTSLRDASRTRRSTRARRSSGSTARSTAGSSPRWSAASATSTSPRRRPARRCSPRSRSGRPTAYRPTPAAG